MHRIFGALFLLIYFDRIAFVLHVDLILVNVFLDIPSLFAMCCKSIKRITEETALMEPFFALLTINKALLGIVILFTDAVLPKLLYVSSVCHRTSM